MVEALATGALATRALHAEFDASASSTVPIQGRTLSEELIL